MAKKWYPVIDVLTCMECGTCVNKCTHGVYNKKKFPVPAAAAVVDKVRKEFCFYIL